MTKPYAEIRSQLLKIRKADRSPAMKDAAEIWIATIDEIVKDGENTDNKRAFTEAYRNFYRLAENEPRPELMSAAEIAKAFGLDQPRPQ